MRTKVASLAALFILTACGGGGSEDRDPTVTIQPPPAAKPPVDTPAPAPTPAAPAPPTPIFVVPGAPVAGPPGPAGPRGPQGEPGVPGMPAEPIDPEEPAPPPPVPAQPSEPVKVTPPAPQPPPPAGTPVQTIPGTSVVKALTGTFKEHFTSGRPDDVTFASVETYGYASTILHNSTWQNFTDATQRNHIFIEMNVAVGPGTLTFSGAGKIAAWEPQHSDAVLVGGQYTIPAQVPLNTSMLHEWKVQGTNSWVRVNVGGLEGKPDEFRLCWDMNYARYARTSCTHHKRSDGTYTGADSVNRGVVHFTNKEATSPRVIMRCEHRTTQRDYTPGSTGPIQTYESYYSMFEWEGATLFKNRAKDMEFAPIGPGHGGSTGIEQQTKSNGQIENRYWTPRSYMSVLRRGNVVEYYYRSAGGTDSGGYVECDPKFG